MAEQKNKTIDVTKYNGTCVTINTVSKVRCWQRKKVCAFLIKLHLYKRFKNVKPRIKLASALNERIQMYNSKHLPRKYTVVLQFEKDGDQHIIHVDEFRNTN